jgi:hypothetical protein
MNDVYAVTRQNQARLMFTNNTSNPLLPDSFLNAFDSGTNFSTYGGINRNQAGNSAFQGNLLNLNSGTFSLGTTGFTRKSMATVLAYVTNQAGGEAPTFVVMNPGDYATLNLDFIGQEQFNPPPGSAFTMDTQVRSSFPNLVVSGVPIFADHFVPQGTVVGPNVKYTAFYLSEDAAFDFSGFYSLVPLGQIGQQGVVVLGYDLITSKPSSGFIGTNLQGNQF